MDPSEYFQTPKREGPEMTFHIPTYDITIPLSRRPRWATDRPALFSAWGRFRFEGNKMFWETN